MHATPLTRYGYLLTQSDQTTEKLLHYVVIPKVMKQADGKLLPRVCTKLMWMELHQEMDDPLG